MTATETPARPQPWQLAIAARNQQRAENDPTVRRCGNCGAVIRHRAGKGWQWSNGLCPCCDMRHRRAAARRPARPRLRSGWYGYNPHLGTARGIAS